MNTWTNAFARRVMLAEAVFEVATANYSEGKNAMVSWLAPTLYPRYIHIASTLYPLFIHISSALHPHCTHISSALHPSNGLTAIDANITSPALCLCRPDTRPRTGDSNRQQTHHPHDHREQPNWSALRHGVVHRDYDAGMPA